MKVSVAMITYNHEKYIAKAIESVLFQKTNFEYEIVISEDCSTDKTRDVILEYKKKFPSKIKLLLHDENIGMNRNFMTTINSCTGKYIAYLEGDDYWISENKLQKQVDFLDNNFDCKFCFHSVYRYNEEDQNDRHRIMPERKKEKSLTLEDVLPYNFIATCSVVFRNGQIKKWPIWMYEVKFNDWPLYVFLLENGGTGCFINDLYGVYRVHRGGVYSKKTELENYFNAIDILNKFNYYFKFKYYRILNLSKYSFYSLVALDLYKKNKNLFFYFILFKMMIIKIFVSPLKKINGLYYQNWFTDILYLASVRTDLLTKILLKFINLKKSFLFSLKNKGFFKTIIKTTKYFFCKRN